MIELRSSRWHVKGIRNLLASVSALLREHEREDNPIDKPIASGGRLCNSATWTKPSRLPSQAGHSHQALGTMIGPYKLMEQIGEGGFGLVFVADQQEPVRRRVALKIIKPGMESREVIARFEAERQAIALMDHPNIARVFDARSDRYGATVFRDGTRPRRPAHRVLRQQEA